MNVNDKIKESFGQIQAERKLRDRTKAAIKQKTRGYTTTRERKTKWIVSTAACFMILLFGGYWFYLIPITQISIDVNPSIELGVNRVDKVVSVKAYNEEGQNLVDAFDIKFMDYRKAVNQILENKEIEVLLSGDAVMTIAVVGSDEETSSKVLSGVEECTRKQKHTHCYSLHSEEVESAHEMGFSYGKYKAFLELKELDPNITSEEVQEMTMREIQDLIDTLSEDEEENGQKNENITEENIGYGHHNAEHESEHGDEHGQNRVRGGNRWKSNE